MTYGIGWRDNVAIDYIISHIQHTAKKGLIAGNTLSLEYITTIGHGFSLNDKAAF